MFKNLMEEVKIKLQKLLFASSQIFILSLVIAAILAQLTIYSSWGKMFQDVGLYVAHAAGYEVSFY
jgi:hypothetical protein